MGVEEELLKRVLISAIYGFMAFVLDMELEERYYEDYEGDSDSDDPDSSGSDCGTEDGFNDFSQVRVTEW